MPSQYTLHLKMLEYAKIKLQLKLKRVTTLINLKLKQYCYNICYDADVIINKCIHRGYVVLGLPRSTIPSMLGTMLVSLRLEGRTCCMMPLRARCTRWARPGAGRGLPGGSRWLGGLEKGGSRWLEGLEKGDAEWMAYM